MSMVMTTGDRAPEPISVARGRLVASVRCNDGVLVLADSRQGDSLLPIVRDGVRKICATQFDVVFLVGIASYRAVGSATGEVIESIDLHERLSRIIADTSAPSALELCRPLPELPSENARPQEPGRSPG